MNKVVKKTFGPTTKKKNTYVVKLDGILGDLSLFQACKTTPLAVLTKNGQSVQSNQCGWMCATPFPNPCAAKMVAEYKLLRPKMGKFANTIVEYLDKETGVPVATLFPTSVYVHDGYENNFKERMNHATRRDFERQIQMRAATQATKAQR